MTTAAAPASGDDGLWGARMHEIARRREEAYRRYLASVDAARRMLDQTTDRLDVELERVTGMREDRAVLVRKTPGPVVTTYHSADHPCGRVTGQARSRSSFKQMLEGEARFKSLHRCSACRWR